MYFRELEFDDWQAAEALDSQCKFELHENDPSMCEKWYRWFYDQGGRIMTAHVNEDGDAMGIAMWLPPETYKERPGDRCVYLWRFGILPSHRQRGHGTRFFSMLCDEFLRVGGNYLWLRARTDNPIGIDFWHSVGCTDVSKVTDEDIEYLELDKYLTAKEDE